MIFIFLQKGAIIKEVHTISYGQRLKNSLGGIFFGIILVFGSIGLLFWNEGRSVETHKSLEEGQSIVISISNDKIDSTNDGKLVHIAGKADITNSIKDQIFGIETKAIKLNRKVQMYQWNEKVDTKTEKNLGGSETTSKDYSYEKVWSENIIDSSKFKQANMYKNPLQMPFEAKSFVNENVILGKFSLPNSLVNQMSNFKPMDLNPDMKLNQIKNAKIYENYIYISKYGSMQKPIIGDIKIEFLEVLPQNVSIIAQQTNNTFQAYQTNAGNKIYTLDTGLKSKDEMFNEQKKSNTFFTWILRIVGIVLMYIGFSSIIKILSVILDVVPLFGNIMEFGTRLISFMLSLIISFVVIAIAWLFYRPIVSVILFILMGVLFYFIKIKRKNTNKEKISAKEDTN